MKIKEIGQRGGIEIVARKVAHKSGLRLLFTCGLAIFMFASGFYFHKRAMKDDKFLLMIKLAKDNVTLIPNVIKGIQSEPARVLL